jgi:hypothetical protein
VIRNPFEGKKLFDGINLNPLTRENIQTAAFFYALGVTNRFTGKIFSNV